MLLQETLQLPFQHFLNAATEENQGILAWQPWSVWMRLLYTNQSLAGLLNDLLPSEWT